jgi:hypothetical protein
MDVRNDGERLFRARAMAVKEQDHLVPVGDVRLGVGGELAKRVGIPRGRGSFGAETR